MIDSRNHKQLAITLNC